MSRRCTKARSPGILGQLASVCLAMAGLIAGPAGAGAEGATQPPIPNVTRLVVRFMELENKLNEAAAARDASTLQAMLSPDFELRIGANPGVPTPRDAWLHEIMRKDTKPYVIEQMAVHDLGNAAVVSFLGRRRMGGNLLTVDVWVYASGEWKLSTRYAAPAGDRRFRIPGWASQSGVLPKQY